MPLPCPADAWLVLSMQFANYCKLLSVSCPLFWCCDSFPRKICDNMHYGSPLEQFAVSLKSGVDAFGCACVMHLQHPLQPML